MVLLSVDLPPTMEPRAGGGEGDFNRLPRVILGGKKKKKEEEEEEK